MANTYTRLLYHCVWSTKDRSPIIHEKIESKVWAYLAGIAQRNKIHAIRIGGIENHVHLLIEIPKTMAVAEAIKQLKGGSSLWINSENLTNAHFAWQDGYSAFTVSPSAIPDVVKYIANQREHHRHKTFEDEYRSFLEKHGVDFDEAYVFG
ncbi:IS200/IS605 family transposase [Haloferula sp.]|uniref:IS200/IS605 family transposase n=1 Tax=Haloferula sp. TaxID=2497595 RepID=UPI003C74D29F